MHSFRWRLPAGTLDLTADCTDPLQLHDLLSVGARQNPKRPFVFVSHVLGKHKPARPQSLRSVQTALAVRLSADPAVFIGMAETATGLAEGVFDSWKQRTRGQGIYLSTTRYSIDRQPALDFTETHSHATDLRLFYPHCGRLLERAAALDRVVLIDDELSTGRTFESLVAALRHLMPRLSRIDVVAITDFSGGQVARRLNAMAGIESVRVSALLSGSFQFQQSGTVQPAANPAQNQIGCRRARMAPHTSRLGYEQAPAVDPDNLLWCHQYADGSPLTLLGTGECMYPAQALGERLTQAGLDVLLQSTTRSPLQVYGPIQSARQVTDPYGEGIPNFLYNAPSAERKVIIIHETGDNEDIRKLVNELRAPALDPFRKQWLDPRGIRSVA